MLIICLSTNMQTYSGNVSSWITEYIYNHRLTYFAKSWLNFELTEMKILNIEWIRGWKAECAFSKLNCQNIICRTLVFQSKGNAVMQTENQKIIGEYIWIYSFSSSFLIVAKYMWSLESYNQVKSMTEFEVLFLHL